MGRPAHARTIRRLDNRNPTVAAEDEIPVQEIAVQEQIEELLRFPSGGRAAPSLAQVEDVLTEGYARALALEGERLRLERRLGEVAREASGALSPGFVDELSMLAKRITHADGELVRLRVLLTRLHDRARALRLAETASSAGAL